MKEESVWNIVEKTPLSRKIADCERLVFVGKQETVDYLQKILASIRPPEKEKYCYCAWKAPEDQNSINFPEGLSSYQAIVVVSETDENSLFKAVKE